MNDGKIIILEQKTSKNELELKLKFTTVGVPVFLRVAYRCGIFHHGRFIFGGTLKFKVA